MNRGTLLLLALVSFCGCGEDTVQSKVGEPDQGIIWDVGEGKDLETSRCESLDENECRESPRCFPLLGSVIVTEDCSSTRFAGCLEGRNCQNQETFVRGPEEACWNFPNLCLPDGFSAPSQSEYEACRREFLGVRGCE